MCNNILDLENENVKEKTMRLTPQEIKLLYRSVRSHMTLDEKIWLMDFRGNMERYEKRLLKLAHKYEIAVEFNKRK